MVRKSKNKEEGKKMKKCFFVCIVMILFPLAVGAGTTTYYQWIVPGYTEPQYSWVNGAESYALTVSKLQGKGQAKYWINLRYRWEENLYTHSTVDSVGPFYLYAGQSASHDLKMWDSYLSDGNILMYVIEVKVTEQLSPAQFITEAGLDSWHTEIDEFDHTPVRVVHATNLSIVFKSAPR